MAQSKLRLIITVLAVAGLLIFLSRFSFFSQIIDAIKMPFRPVQSRIYSATTQAGNFVDNFFLSQKYEETIESMTKRIVALSRENIQLKKLKSENETLRKILNFKEEAMARELVMARIVGQNLAEPTILTIDKGARHGLSPNQAVITEKGILIGKLIKVDYFTSELMLLTDGRSEISGSVARANRQAGVVVGEKGLSLKMQLIPSDEDIKIDDIIVSSGLENEIPYGLIVGQVEQINQLPNELFKETIIKTLIPYNNAVLVAVVIR